MAALPNDSQQENSNNSDELNDVEFNAQNARSISTQCIYANNNDYQESIDSSLYQMQFGGVYSKFKQSKASISTCTKP